MGRLDGYANLSQCLARIDAVVPHSSISPNFGDCLTVGEAAQFLGVSAGTLRNWDRSGKLKPRRHPQNGYRIYLREDLEAVLRSAELSKLRDESIAPPVVWSRLRETGHFVQFYEREEFLLHSVTAYIEAALRGGDSCVVLATPDHRESLQQKLAAMGIDVAKAQSSGRYVAFDAAVILSSFMVDATPDPQRFDDAIGGVIRQMCQHDRRVYAFGEMVAILWAQGNRKGAIELENLWNELAKEQPFTLYCAYPMSEFGGSDHGDGFEGICSCHTRVIPTESYAAADSVDKRLRTISSLQQKAQSLETEIEHRQQVERALAERERELADVVENALQGTLGADRTATISPPNTPAGGQRRILVADDNRDACRTMSMLLRAKGHEVRTAADGLEAISVAEEFRPDVILMDLSMPKLNGYEATRRLRDTPYGKEIEIIALTGWGQTSDVNRSIEAGCTAHLVKPVDFAELDRLLAHAVVH
jgi:CheY-like chemotaxis protein